jgi:hypothetical protein
MSITASNISHKSTLLMSWASVEIYHNQHFIKNQINQPKAKMVT